MEKPSIVVCLTGLLARSIDRTLAAFQKLIRELEESGEYSLVSLAIFAIDPSKTPVDEVVVSHVKAYEMISKSELKDHIVHTIVKRQSELDEISFKSVYLKIPWILCHGRRDLPCVPRCKQNMRRHILIERECANFLRSCDYDLAMSISPDIEVQIENISSLICDIQKARENSGLVVPESKGGPFLINGFCAGTTTNLLRFLERAWIYNKMETKRCLSALSQIKRERKEYLNWEMMCWATAQIYNLILFQTPVLLIKHRASLKSHKAWAGYD